MGKRDLVVLVDEHGHNLYHRNGKLYTMEKIEAHRRGLLHRAVSVFIFSDRNEILLQKRAAGKYHSAGKWSNTCCTHPLPREAPLVAAQRRLIEEMGIVATLTEAFTFSYQADTGDGLTEEEFDHVFIGCSNQNPNPNPTEVSDWKWVTMDELERELMTSPEDYTPWLAKCFARVIEYRVKGRR